MIEQNFDKSIPHYKEINTNLLNKYTNNSRIHSSDQIKQIVNSIKEFGFTNPLLVDETNQVIAGHGRLEAAKILNMTKLPCIVLSHLNESQKRAYIIADNKLALNSGWDIDKLQIEFGFLKDNDFNIELTGFSIDELCDLFPNDVPEIFCDEDDCPDIPEEPTTKPGDVWLLGEHRLMCGDSTCINAVDKLMNGVKAVLLHTDPPYNVNYSNADRPKPGKKNFGKIKNDDMSKDNFYKFLYDFYVCAYSFLDEDATAYIWHTSSEHINFTQALVDSGFLFSQQIIWKKPMLLGRGKYQWAHDPCLLGIKGSPYFTTDRTKTTVWDFGGYDKSKNVHPTQKPVFIPEEAINNSSKIDDNILDLFGGSGSTLIACEKTQRKCFMMELDCKYNDVIIKRYQQYSGKEAVHEATGKTWNQLTQEMMTAVKT